MARTITVMDDDSGVVTTVVVAKNDEGLSTVKEIRFTTANGGGLGELDLSILRDFGLVDSTPALPAPEPVVEVATTPPPVRRPAKSARGGRKGRAAGRTTDRLGRGYRRAPDVEELKQLFADLGGPGAVAQALDVPAHSVQGWLRRFKREGHEFPIG